MDCPAPPPAVLARAAMLCGVGLYNALLGGVVSVPWGAALAGAAVVGVLAGGVLPAAADLAAPDRPQLRGDAPLWPAVCGVAMLAAAGVGRRHWAAVLDCLDCLASVALGTAFGPPAPAHSGTPPTLLFVVAVFALGTGWLAMAAGLAAACPPAALGAPLLAVGVGVGTHLVAGAVRLRTRPEMGRLLNP